MPDTDNAKVRIRLTWETRRPYEKSAEEGERRGVL